jgi:hypothetical protein
VVIQGDGGRWVATFCIVICAVDVVTAKAGNAAPVNHALDEVIALHVLSAVWKSSRQRKEGAMTKLRVHVEDDNDDVRGTFQERLESYCKNIQRAPTGAAAGFSWRPG